MPDDANNKYSPDTQPTTRVVPPPSPEEASRVAAAMAMFQSAADNRRYHEPRGFESLAFYLGNQYVTYNQTSHMLQAQRKPREPHKVYETRNLIRPKINKLLARALRNDPDSTVAPDTPATKDRAAAMEGRAVIAHQDQLQHSPMQMWRMARWASTFGTTCLLQWWNPDAEAEVPDGWNPQTGEISGSTRAKVGEMCEEICMPSEVYFDPKAREWSELRWAFRVKTRSIDEIRERYTESGWKVKGDPGTSGPLGYVESRMATTVGEYPRGYEPGQAARQAAVYELFVKPNTEHKEGQWLTTCDGRIMEDGPLPDWLNGELPLIDLSYEPGQGTCYGLNAVYDLIGAQRSYNNAMSRLAEHLRTMWGKILAQEGSRIDTTAFDSAKPNEIVYYAPRGGPPEHLRAPELPNFVLDLLKVSRGDMEDMSGVHEISEGSVPTGVTAAAAIKLLQESDVTQMASFTSQIERFIEIRDQRRLMMAKRYYKEPRLVFLSQTAGTKLPAIAAPGQPPPQPGPQQPGQPNVQGVTPSDVPDPIMQAMSFEALASGSCRIVVTPGSAAPKSPEAEFEQVLEMVKIGLFGPTGDPTTAQIALKLLNYQDPSTVVEAMEQAIEKRVADQAALTPDPMALQQQKLEMTERMMGITEAIKTHGQISVLQAKAQIDQAMAEINHKFEAMMEAIKSHAALMLKAEPGAPAIALSGELHATADASAEEAAGLEPDTPAEIKADKPVPASPAGGKEQP